MSLLTQASLVLTPTAYKANKLYSVVPSSGSGDLTTTRATTATRVNSSGLIENVATGIPRVDYTGGVANILLEPQRTNLLPNSEDFSNGWGLVRSSVVINTASSPSGYITADKLNQLAGQTTHGAISEITSLQQESKYTWTIFAKKEEKGFIRLAEKMTTNGVVTGTWFNLVNGTIGTIALGHTAVITNAGNGWFRCSITFTANYVTNDPLVLVYLSDVDNSTTVVDSGGVYVWGSQLEQGAYATSYIPTTTSTVTRNADLASVSGVTSLIGQTEGVIFIESAALFNDLTQREISISDGTNLNRITLYYNTLSNQITVSMVSAGIITIISIHYIISDATQFAKMAVRYSNTLGVSLWVNGVNRVNSAETTLPISMSKFSFDRATLNNTPFYGKVKSAQLYKTYLTDAEMALLTTL